MKTAVMACMRNEAMFVLEWVAYHRVIGFDHVFVCTNNCDDGTDALLDRLGDLGVVTHLRNDDHGAIPAQRAGVAKVLAHPDTAKCRWLLRIDADEYLNIHAGNGQLDDWLPMVDAFDAVAVTWRLFGDSAVDRWPRLGLQTEILTRCAAKSSNFTAMQKTMFDPRAFAEGHDHMPKSPLRQVTLCNAVGRRLDPAAMYDPKSADHRDASGGSVNRRRHMPWQGAVINHYAVRTRDLFLMKNVRGAASGSTFRKRYLLNSRWHRASNANDVEDISIQRHLPAIRTLIAQWREADPGISRIENAAYDWFNHTRDAFLTEDTMAALTNPSRKAA